MRLIDADALIEKFNNSGIKITFDLPVEEIIDDFSILVQDAIQAYRKIVIATIKEQPSAYDVDKVVEELESEAKRWQESGEEYEDQEELGIAKGYRLAIKDVKAGGVNE